MDIACAKTCCPEWALGVCQSTRRAEEFKSSLGEIFTTIQHRSLAQQISAPLIFLELAANRTDEFWLVKITRVFRQVLEQPDSFLNIANSTP